MPGLDALVPGREGRLAGVGERESHRQREPELNPGPEALLSRLATVRAILIRTHASGSAELRLIESRDDILNPFELPMPYSEIYTPDPS